MRSCGFKSHLPHKRHQFITGVFFVILETNGGVFIFVSYAKIESVLWFDMIKLEVEGEKGNEKKNVTNRSGFVRYIVRVNIRWMC